ncbi:hypothetical protein M422DRAFT_257560 [Sphaerobolus stellatus SS14]|uniref:Unplaced genomic scaffold SPHSTscaffold_75, whole genome shotgun sequence n=1 Tax=Sphaerobolus stellatus (strain SS14) TaxID=990650 RepID=A0A0C9VE96_SPHS4|nr:hypothetical protein M422DRAFT_257560 [Sphaerobolus stellatus SS14]
MPLQVVRKVAFWKKSSIKHTGESSDAGGDWIADALKVANLLIVVSDAVPGVGGFIKGAAGVFIALLDPVQQMGKNKEDCKMLIMSIVELLQTVNQELRMIPTFEDMTMDTYSNAWSNFERHVSMFHTFLNRRPYLYPLSSRAMEGTKKKLIKLNSKGRALSRYIRGQKIRDIILSYQSEMQRLQNNLLLANSLAMRLQVTNIEATTNRFIKNDQKNRNDEDDIEMDDASISHLVTTLPTLFQGACLDFLLEYTAINSSVSYSYARFGQLQIREYQSTGIDDRIVLALELINPHDLSEIGDFRVSVYSTYSLSEGLLRKIANPTSIPRSNKRELISILHAFHSLIPLHEFEWDIPMHEKNPPLGGIILGVPIPPRSGYKQGPSCLEPLIASFEGGSISHSGWHNIIGILLHEQHQIQSTFNGLRISFPPDCEVTTPYIFRFSVTKSIPGENVNMYHSFLAQVNSLLGTAKEICVHDTFGEAYKFILCDRIMCELEIPHRDAGQRQSETLYLFIENPTVDHSGYALDPKIYWSTCPSGTTSLTVLQAYSLGIKYFPSLTKTLHALEYVYTPERDILSTMYEACSLNPESDEVSQLLGFPLPERKDFHFPKPKRRLSCSDFETMKRTDCSDSAHFQLPDEQNISENYRTFLTADKVPSFLQSYDLRTTGHELIYQDLDIQPIHEELPIHIKVVVS